MPNLKLHIVSFDVPYPADYGGAIDVFYKLKNLHRAGCEIYLHCYEYGRQHSTELNKYCKEVWYYPRITGIKGSSFVYPYIVYSRRDKELLKRLESIDAPILFEGVHTTYFLQEENLAERFKAIRTHNIEHEYYKQLFDKEEKFFKKTFFAIEAALLKKYERDLKDANAFFALSKADDAYFAKAYPGAIHDCIPAFHPYDEVKIKTGLGDYCLYHGNLSHPENREAAIYLLKEVFPHINSSFIIAGRNPDEELIALCNKLPNGKVMANPTEVEMTALIENAQVHVLPTFQATGLKLKLLYALFNGRHVLVNNEMLHGSGLEQACHIATDNLQFIGAIKNLMELPFTDADVANRSEILAKDYNNLANAKRLLTYLPH